MQAVQLSLKQFLRDPSREECCEPTIKRECEEIVKMLESIPKDMFAACADCFRAAARRDFSSGEEPLHGGAFQKIAPTPGKPISPEENIQNVWELRRSLRSPEETKHRPFDGGQRLEVASAPASGRCTEERSKK